MDSFTIKRLVRLIPVVAALAIVIVSARPATAASCAADLGQCYQSAAGLDSLLDRYSAGLDCELTYIGCLRDALEY